MTAALLGCCNRDTADLLSRASEPGGSERGPCDRGQEAPNAALEPHDASVSGLLLVPARRCVPSGLRYDEMFGFDAQPYVRTGLVQNGSGPAPLRLMPRRRDGHEVRAELDVIPEGTQDGVQLWDGP